MNLLVEPALDASDETAPTASSSGTELLSGLRAGDDAAYESLVRVYGGRMLATARRFLHQDSDARDAVQDAFLSAFRSIDSFEGGASLGTWLHRIVINAALMKLRSRRRRPEESIEELLPTFAADGRRDGATRECREGIARAVQRNESSRIVHESIAQLPENYRNVVLLRDIEGLSTLEAASVLGVSENAVKVRLHRARQALRELLVPYFTEDAECARNDRPSHAETSSTSSLPTWQMSFRGRSERNSTGISRAVRLAAVT